MSGAEFCCGADLLEILGRPHKVLSHDGVRAVRQLGKRRAGHEKCIVRLGLMLGEHDADAGTQTRRIQRTVILLPQLVRPASQVAK